MDALGRSLAVRLDDASMQWFRRWPIQRTTAKTQVRKTKVPEDGICKYGKHKYESATLEKVSIAT